MRAPIIGKLFRLLKYAGLSLLCVAVFATCVELGRIFLLLRRFHPWIAYAFLGIVVLLALGAWIWWLAWTRSAELLDPPETPADGARSHRDLIVCNRFMIARLNRLARNTALTDEQREHLLQAAHRAREITGHHPLNDDLTRTLARTASETLYPAYEVLRKRAETYARTRMRAVVNDVLQPAFPASQILTVYSYELILISRIVDIYYPGATLPEYRRVIWDVTDVVTRGRFFELGQLLFAGVLSNSPPLGRAADALGQALISLWLTRTVSMATMLRCEDMRAWSVDRAVADLDARVLDMLAESKSCLLEEVLPVLKQVIRHNVAPHVSDAAGFSSGVIDGLTRAIDAAIHAHQALPRDTAVQSIRQTLPGAARLADETLDASEFAQRRRRRRRRRENSLTRILFVVSQRIKYTMHRPE